MAGQDRIRLLLVRHPYDGHERGYHVVARGLRDAGIEVILGGPQLASQIAETALQEDADIIGYRIMAGSPAVLVPLLLQKLGERGLSHIPVVVGGIIPEKDVLALKNLGVRAVFHPGTPLTHIIATIREIATSAARRSFSWPTCRND